MHCPTRKEHFDRSVAGSPAAWLRISSLPERPRRVMIDNCAGASFFSRGYDDNAVDDHAESRKVSREKDLSLVQAKLDVVAQQTDKLHKAVLFHQENCVKARLLSRRNRWNMQS